jgi:Uma2 family endonuclease
MVELKLGLRTVDLPYTVRLPGVTEEVFDELVDEDTRAELIDGVMVVHSPASMRHDDLAEFLRALARCYAETKKLGRVFGPDSLVHLATCRKFGPDYYFLEAKRVPRPLPKKQFEGAPDLVGEVLSPSNRDEDLQDKRPAYQEAGVKEIWLIDPDGQEVIVDRRHGKSYRTRAVHEGRVESAVLRGFWVEAAWLWADPLPEILACLREILGEGPV